MKYIFCFWESFGLKLYKRCKCNKYLWMRFFLWFPPTLIIHANSLVFQDVDKAKVLKSQLILNPSFGTELNSLTFSFFISKWGYSILKLCFDYKLYDIFRNAWCRNGRISFNLHFLSCYSLSFPFLRKIRNNMITGLSMHEYVWILQYFYSFLKIQFGLCVFFLFLQYNHAEVDIRNAFYMILRFNFWNKLEIYMHQ